MRWWIVILSSALVFDCSSAPEPAVGTVPARPENAPRAKRGAPITFALDTLFLGDLARDGDIDTVITAPSGCSSSPHDSTSGAAWKAFGYDLDGVVTAKDSSDVCTLGDGAPKGNQVDGVGGIDNAWGAVLVPLIETSLSIVTLSGEETKIIRGGTWTLQIQVDGLPTDGASVDGIATQLFVGGTYDDGTPSFDSSTDWPVLESSLVDAQTIAGGAVAAFEDGYVSSGTFVSGSPDDAQTIVLPLVLRGVRLELKIHRAIFTATRASSDPARLMTGTIAGVIDTAELLETLRRVAGLVSLSICGDAFDGIAAQIAQAQDILADETNPPSVPCAAISIGLGFTARQITNPTKVSADPVPPPNPCPAVLDAGTDAADASSE